MYMQHSCQAHGRKSKQASNSPPSSNTDCAACGRVHAQREEGSCLLHIFRRPNTNHDTGLLRSGQRMCIKRLRRVLQQQALLRVHVEGLGPADAKGGGIKQLRPGNEAAEAGLQGVGGHGRKSVHIPPLQRHA